MHWHPITRLLASVLLVYGLVTSTKAQCPVITGSSSMPVLPATVCQTDVITFSITGTDFPPGADIDWYIDPNPPFNPYLGEGTLIGTSPVTQDFVWAVPLDFCSTFGPGTHFIRGILSPPPAGACPEIFTDYFGIIMSCPTASLTGGGIVCVGNCPENPAQIGFSFTGGLPPYDITLTLSLSIFPDITLPGIAINANESLNICVQGLLPGFDPATNTIIIPELLAGLSGTITLNSLVDALGCTGTIVPPGSISIAILPEATANAGPDLTICEGSLVNLSGSVGGSASSGMWSSAGDGIFADPADLNTTYTPGPGDLAAGSVVLTLVSDDVGGFCSMGTSNLTVTMVEEPVAAVGMDLEICGITPVTVSGMAGGSGNTWTWTSNGTGSFVDPGALTTEYIPSADDLSSGMVTLTFTVTSAVGGCPEAMASMTLTLIQPPSVDIGTDLIICSNAVAPLQAALGGTATSGIWSTSGDGTFDDSFILNPIYTPGTGDINSNPVVITFITDDFGGLCPADTAMLELSIQPAIEIEEIPDIESCNDATIELSAVISGTYTDIVWITSGDGTFDNSGDLFTFYQPGDNDTLSGSVVLTITATDANGVCAPEVEQLEITFMSCVCPDVETLSPIDPVCNDGSVFDLSNLLLTTEPGFWTIIAPPAGSNPAMIDGDFFGGLMADTGLYTIRYTLETPMPGCPDSSEQVIQVVAPPTVVAGADVSSCDGDTVFLSVTVSNNSIVEWTTLGNGTFTDANEPTTQYIPDASDIAAGGVSIIVSGTNPDMVCPGATDTIEVTFLQSPFADFSSMDLQVCNDTSSQSYLDLSGLITGGDTGGSWTEITTSGADLANPAIVSFTGVAAGTYMFQYETAGATVPCEETVYVVTVSVLDCSCPEISIFSSVTLCNTDSSFNLNTLVVNAGPGTWTVSGVPTGSAPATLMDSLLDIQNADDGLYLIMYQLDTIEIPGCPDTATVEVLIQARPQASAGEDTTVCGAGVILLNGGLGGSADEVTWSTTGDGQFGNASQPNTTYTPGIADLANGSALLTLTAIDSSGVCMDTSDNVLVSFVAPPIAQLSTSALTVCNAFDDGSLLDLAAIVTGGDQSGIWEDLNSSGVDLSDPAQVNFDGVAAGVFNFGYTTQSAVPPCNDTTYVVSVAVEDCACPSVALNPPSSPICDDDILNLKDFLLTSEPGVWTIGGMPTGSSPAFISTDSLFDARDADPGSYTLVFTLIDSVAGCPGSASMSLSVEANPDDAINNTTVYCSSEDYNTIVILTHATIVTASAGVVTVLPGDTVLIEYVPASTTVSINLETPGGCATQFDVVAIDCSCALSVDLPVDISFCLGDSVTLTPTVTGATGNYTGYLINGMDTLVSTTFVLTQPGNYQYYVRDDQLCEAQQLFHVQVSDPVIATLMVDDVSCDGSADGSVTLEALSGGLGPIFFSINGSIPEVITTVPFMIGGLEIGTHLLQFTDSIACTTDLQIMIDGAPEPSVNLGPDIAIAAGDSVLISATIDFFPASISWNPPLIDDTSLSGWITPISDLTIVLTVTDSAGCVYSNSTDVTILSEPSRGVYIPNVFSPNGDQVNDRFTIYAQAGQIEVLYVYDRWGNLVFKGNAIPPSTPAVGWDGTMLGKAIHPGVYAYYARLVSPDGSIRVLSGDVTLIR